MPSLSILHLPRLDDDSACGTIRVLAAPAKTQAEEGCFCRLTELVVLHIEVTRRRQRVLEEARELQLCGYVPAAQKLLAVREKLYQQLIDIEERYRREIGTTFGSG